MSSGNEALSAIANATMDTEGGTGVAAFDGTDKITMQPRFFGEVFLREIFSAGWTYMDASPTSSDLES